MITGCTACATSSPTHYATCTVTMPTAWCNSSPNCATPGTVTAVTACATGYYPTSTTVCASCATDIDAGTLKA